MLVVCGADDPAVGEDDGRFGERIDREAEPSHEPADAAAEREAADAGVRDDAGGDDESVRLGAAVDVTEQRAAPDADALADGIDDTWLIARRSITRPPSTVENPGRECPPPRTAIFSPRSRP